MMQDRRIARRYGMALPVKVDLPAPEQAEHVAGQTRDISPHGLYFTTDNAPQPDSVVSLTLSLPPALTGGEGVLVEVLARILRIEPAAARGDRRIGVAAKIVQYDIFRANETRPN